MAGTIATSDQHGVVRRRLDVGSFPVSFDWLVDGSLVVVSGGTGLLLISDGEDSLVTFADLRGLARHPWNEIAVHRSGNIYVNGIGMTSVGRHGVGADRARAAGRHGGKRRFRPCFSERHADQH